MPPGDADMGALGLVTGQPGLQHVIAADRGLPPSPPHLPQLRVDDEAVEPPTPPAPARRPRRQPAKPVLAVRFPGGQTHWLAATYRTGCGRRIGGTAIVIEAYWITCSVCDRKERPIPAADAPSLLTADAAERLHITPQRLGALARDGVLGHKVGRSWVFTVKELTTYKRQQKRKPEQPIARRTPATRTSRSRVSRADMEGAYLLDRLLGEERALEQRYELPFRAPQQTATTIHACPRCGRDMVFLIFGDAARNEAGLLAYGRLLDEPIRRQNLITLVMGPPQGPAQDNDTPSLLLQVWPTIGTMQITTPGTWDALLADLSQMHCGRSSSSRSEAGSATRNERSAVPGGASRPPAERHPYFV